MSTTPRDSTTPTARPGRHRGRRVGCAGRARPGLSLVEVVISIAIIATIFPAIFSLVGAAATRGLASQRNARAAWLAQDLLAEIGAKPCEADSPDVLPGLFGAVDDLLDGVTQGGSRASFTNVFDYDAWASSPPVDEAGDPIPGYAGWSRVASVSSVNPETLLGRSKNDAAALITVTVVDPGGVRTSFTVLRTKGLDILRDTTNDADDEKGSPLEAVGAAVGGLLGGAP